MEISLIQIEKGKPVKYNVDVTINNYWFVRKKLDNEYQQITDILKILKEEGAIKSIWIPKNKKLQKYLDELVEAKLFIKQTIKKLIILFS